MSDISFTTLHHKMNFLLKDHGVESLDESDLNLEAVSSLHAKANALCSAHGGDPSTMASETLTELQPKLDFLLKGHGVAFDATGLDLESLEAVDVKLDAIVNAHEAGH